MSVKMPQWATRLYHGENNYDFLRHRRKWYAVSAVLLLVSVVSLATLKLNFNIDFTGGTQFRVSQASCDVPTAEKVVTDFGYEGQPRVQQLGGEDIRIQMEQQTEEQGSQLQNELAQACGIPPDEVLDRVSQTSIGANWGSEVTNTAVKGLVVFLILITVFLAFYFEWKMAIAAMIALLHDIVVTMGLYSLIGLEVSPATVIGLLTVLSYSLYDTVVVFDKVKENTNGLATRTRSTYAEETNLAVNQSLVRSLNTTILGILPVAAIFSVGSFVLGAGTLRDVSLILLIGQAVGAYSSIFVASPLLVQLKNRDPAIQAHNHRVEQRRSSPRMMEGAQGRAAVTKAPRTSQSVLSTTMDGTQGVPEEGDDSSAGLSNSSARVSQTSQKTAQRKQPSGKKGKKRR